MTTATLRTAEAVDLAHALVAEVAASLDIRVMFIKGPSLAWWGLRPPRTSADADALVEPARQPELVAALQRLGWHERTASVPVAARRHSVTLVHPLWPCDLDLHSFYPGIFVEDEVAFDVMWASRARMAIAGVEVDVPSRAASTCILALHALRAPASARTARELPALVTTVRDDFTPDELVALQELAAALRCREPLAPFLRGLGVAAPHELTDHERRSWQLRSTADPTTTWIMMLSSVPWWSRPRLLWTALTYVDLADPGRGDPGSWTRCRYRTRRLGRGARASVRAVRRHHAAGRRPAP